MDNNPSPGNKAGGLTTILEKSLGAVAKAGASALIDVIEYAEPIAQRGLVFMDSPGFDPCSATGQVASGATMIAFTTGRGSAYRLQALALDQAVVRTARSIGRMSEDIDIDCGPIATGDATIEDKGGGNSRLPAGGRLRDAQQERGAGLWRGRVRALADRRGDVDVALTEIVTRSCARRSSGRRARRSIRPARPHYLGAAARPNEKNRWFLFRKTFELAGAPTRRRLSITVDGRYVLYVNGERIGRGPVRCSPLFQRYDDYDLAGVLTAGRQCRWRCWSTPTAATPPSTRRSRACGSRPSATAACGPKASPSAGGRVSLSTAEGWRCVQSDAWTQDTPQSNHSLGFIEDLDAAALPEAGRRRRSTTAAGTRRRP